jgi:putative redox protein
LRRHLQSPPMSGAKPQPKVELVWSSDLQFGATTGRTAIAVDGNGVTGPSPVHLLGMALLGCMAADVVDILRKGRHPLTHFHAALTGERAPDPPRRLLSVAVHFAVHGDVPPAAIERAIQLSREKYCSVWHSLRQDIELTASFDVHGAS